MSAHWHVGMEVECIKDATRTVDNINLGFPMFKKGEKYTIAGIETYGDVDGVFLSFAECDYRHIGHESGFRPITKRKTSIEVFKRLLTPSDKDKHLIEVFDFVSMQGDLQ